jgi:serine acetyltransferase
MTARGVRYGDRIRSSTTRWHQVGTIARMTAWELLCHDVAAGWGRPLPASALGRLVLVVPRLATVRGLATAGFRASQAAGRMHGGLGSLVKQCTQVLTGADIDYRAVIGPGLRLLHPGSVVIAPQAVIGARFTIHSGATVGADSFGAPTIGDDANLAPGSRVLGNITLGNRIWVYPNAVVTRSVERDGVVLAGLPARVVRETREGDFRRPRID